MAALVLGIITVGLSPLPWIWAMSSGPTSGSEPSGQPPDHGELIRCSPCGIAELDHRG